MKIILTKGLPGSGKSSWAKDYQRKHPDTVLVNKDDLRGMLHQNKWSKHREAFVLEIRNAIIIRALQEGKDVIVHDTNLHPKHKVHMEEIAKLPDLKGKVEILIEDFTTVPLDICIKRDLQRYGSVGEKVIKDMYRQFIQPAKTPPVWLDRIPGAVICDLDGTLALFGNENPYERDFSKDVINAPVANVLQLNKMHGNKIILVSGRKDKFEKVTREWLANNFIEFDELHMRKTQPEGVQEPKDVLVKEQIYRDHIEGKYNVVMVLDDRDQVVDFWRSQGLTCFQVAYGDF